MLFDMIRVLFVCMFIFYYLHVSKPSCEAQHDSNSTIYSSVLPSVLHNCIGASVNIEEGDSLHALLKCYSMHSFCTHSALWNPDTSLDSRYSNNYAKVIDQVSRVNAYLNACTDYNYVIAGRGWVFIKLSLFSLIIKHVIAIYVKVNLGNTFSSTFIIDIVL